MNLDPYSQLTRLVQRLKKPLDALLATHEEFLLQNLSSINDIKTLKPFRRNLARALENDNAIEKGASTDPQQVTSNE